MKRLIKVAASEAVRANTGSPEQLIAEIEDQIDDLEDGGVDSSANLNTDEEVLASFSADPINASWMDKAAEMGLEPMDVINKFRDEFGTDPLWDGNKVKKQFRTWAEEYVNSCSGASADIPTL